MRACVHTHKLHKEMQKKWLRGNIHQITSGYCQGKAVVGGARGDLEIFILNFQKCIHTIYAP